MNVQTGCYRAATASTSWDVEWSMMDVREATAPTLLCYDNDTRLVIEYSSAYNGYW